MSPVFDSTRTWSPKAKVKPNLDQQRTKLLNLTVLQRIDPYIEEILITASRVTLYKFNTDLNQWNRKDVDGSLFVVKRNAEPSFQFIVMNRLNEENYVEHLVQGFKYEVHVPYILYRNALEEINGIWFYVANDCEEAAKLFSRILGAKSKVYPKSPVISGKSELREPEAVPSSAVIEAPLEPTPSAACSRGRPEDSSVVNLFSTAMTTGYGSQNNLHFGQLVDKKRPCGSLSHVSDATRSCGSNLSSFPVIPVSVPTMNLGERCEPLRNSQPANLLKPSCLKVAAATPSVIETPGTSLASVSAFHHLMTPQHQHKTQILPFPPPPSSPTLPPLLSTNPNLTSNYGQINRERVHYALQTLVQDNQFIDMVYQALLKVHQS